jgi:glyoxylase-like metal-dependent hydrolase (beta-lactamase superfamily II)
LDRINLFRSFSAFSYVQFAGDLSTVWPFSATEEEIKNRSVPRVEIFKLPGGAEYVLHDIDENNRIIAKARLSAQVKVSELMSVDGFGGKSFLDTLSKSSNRLLDDGEADEANGLSVDEKPEAPLPPPTFHPPSFGVTVLGNSHGFDKSGSVSGYVLWINGRGIMIDPPPYSSATLEREGIRPRLIVGIILTHCHADHDAGAFQKVLTGSPVVVITTPTIYKSFIRKYAALAALSPALLRHSHRYKPAIIGQPLQFQGATFKFIYSLHTIPCIGFHVEWRGRSIVFTGDHFNSPEGIDKLRQTGVLSFERADDLQSIPLFDCDVLLHEAGAPPIHTPLEVLMKLPEKIKNRLYVVHSSALPENSGLKLAPTGTKGTIRLDHGAEMERALDQMGSSLNRFTSFNLDYADEDDKAPLISMRPGSSTDAWFILNLLSAVPFMSRYGYV